MGEKVLHLSSVSSSDQRVVGNKTKSRKDYEKAVEVHQEALRQFELATKARESFNFSAQELTTGLQNIQDSQNALNTPNSIAPPSQHGEEGIDKPTDGQAKEAQPMEKKHGEEANIHKQAAQHLFDKLEALRFAGNVEKAMVPVAPFTVGGKRKGEQVEYNNSKKTKTGNQGP